MLFKDKVFLTVKMIMVDVLQIFKLNILYFLYFFIIIF